MNKRKRKYVVIPKQTMYALIEMTKLEIKACQKAKDKLNQNYYDGRVTMLYNILAYHGREMSLALSE